MNCLLFATLFIALLFCCPAHSEPVNVPAFTALSEPAPNGIEVREGDGVYNWADKTQSLVWYGDLRDAGALKVALKLILPAGATARWRLSITGQNPTPAQGQNFTLEANATGTGAPQDVNFGEVAMAQPGFYRLALTGLEKSGATFGAIKTLVLDGPAAASIV